MPELATAPPPIYAPPAKPIRLPFAGRLVALGIALSCIALMYTSWRLVPSPSGVGTHRAMGFYACNMLVATGIPCPSCGMTTSFAWFYKGHLLASLYLQPAGFVLAYLVFALCFFSLYEACTGRPVHRILRLFRLRWFVLTGAAVAVLGWAWKTFLILRHIDGWS